MIILTKIFYCKNTENELKSYYNKTDWANFVWMQDSWMLLKSDSISWQKILQNSHNSQMQWPVVNTLFQEKKKHHNQKGWIQGNTEIGPVLEVATCCLHGEYGVEIRIMFMNIDNCHSWVRISHGLNKLVTNLNNNEQETSRSAVRRKSVEIECEWFCKSIKGQSKTTKTQFFQLIHNNYTYCGENLDWCWTRKTIAQRFFQCRRKLIQLLRHGSLPRDNDGAIEFWRIKDDLQTYSCIVIIGLTKSGRTAWQEEDTKDINIVLILQEQFWTSELFKVIQDAISLVLHYRTMPLFRATFSSTIITSDVQSNYIPSSFQDWIREDKIWAADRHYFSACGSHGHDPLGSTTSCTKHALLWRKDWSSIKHDRTQSFFNETLPAYCIPKVVRMEIGEVIYEKVYASPRPPPKISLKHDWMKELGSEVAGKAKSSQPTQTQIQIMIERGDPLFAEKERPVLRKSKHVSLVTARTSI